MHRHAIVMFAAMLAIGLLAKPRDVVAAETNQFDRPPTWAVELTKPGLPNLHQVTTNLYRGAQPTAEGMVELKALGVKTVINLRAYHSDKDELAQAGSELKPSRFHMKAWRAKDEDVIQFLRIMSDTNQLPAFVHCQHGADRTGLACAMYRITLCGWTKQEALDEMTRGDFGFHQIWKNLVTYIKRVDVDKIKQRAGITTQEPSGQR